MEFTQEYLNSLRAEYANQASEGQFTLWVEECRMRGLMPQRDVVLQIRGVSEYDSETRQKVFRKRAIYITTIAALRKLAERTGKYAGQLPSKWVYLDADGNPTIESEIPLPEAGSNTRPRRPWAVKTYILRSDFNHPVCVPARFEAYCQSFTKDGKTQLNSTWETRGPEQLEKCSEAAGMRKAFPELQGLYLAEEINDESVVQAAVQPESGDTKSEDKPKRGRPKKSESVQNTPNPGVSSQTLPATSFNFGANQDSATQPITGSAAPSVATAPVHAPGAEPSLPSESNIHGLIITDDDLPENLQPEKPATDEERKIIKERVHKLLPDADDRTKLIHYCKTRFNVGTVSELSMAKWEQVFADLEKDKGIINGH